jgi:hypothetical protein
MYDDIKIMKLGPNYAFEKEPKFYIKEQIFDTENAISHLAAKLQNGLNCQKYV